MGGRLKHSSQQLWGSLDVTGGLGRGRKGRLAFVPEAKPAGCSDDPWGTRTEVSVCLELGPEHTTVTGGF